MKTMPVRPLVLEPLLAALLACGCEMPGARRARDAVSHFAAPAGGGRAATCAAVAGRGDFGLGVLADGRAFALNAGAFSAMAGRGGVEAVAATGLVSSATVTRFEPAAVFDVENVDRGLLERALRMQGFADTNFFGVRVRGAFREVLVSDADRPEAAGLALGPVAGTVSGFHVPQRALPGVRPGYALYFVDEAGARGGLVLDLKLTRGRIEVDPGSAIRVVRP
jgi:alpha-acetolactate decarboxylase